MREDSQESSDEQESIDHIEERINKLQRDLDKRLSKPGFKQNDNKAAAGKIVPKGALSNPPIPTKTATFKKPFPQANSENRMGASNEDKKNPEKTAEFFQ